MKRKHKYQEEDVEVKERPRKKKPLGRKEERHLESGDNPEERERMSE